MTSCINKSMFLTFLGTSSGTPTLRRNVSAIAYSPQNRKEWYLVDCGEGTQQQILRSHLSPMGIKAVFITHNHGDHCYGLPGLLSTLQMLGRTTPLTVVAPQSVAELFQAVKKHSDLHINYPIEFVDVTASGTLYTDTNVHVKALPLSHRTPSYAYLFKAQGQKSKLLTDKLLADNIPKGPSWGKILKTDELDLADGRRIVCKNYRQLESNENHLVIAGDNDSPELIQSAYNHVSQLIALVHEATYTESVLQKVGPRVQHSCASQVAKFAHKASIPNLFLTHFSPRYKESSNKSSDLALQDIANEAQQHYQGNLILAQDLVTYEAGQGSIFKPLL